MKEIDKAVSAFCDVVAEDGLGRKMGPLIGINTNKQVGLFYFLWIGQHKSAAYDNAKLPLDVQMNDRSSEDMHHYWSKPLFGYYNSEDEWVFRKHLQMFVYAGIDYLVFDATNGYFYPEVCRKIFPVALEMLREGWNIPRFIFDTNWNSRSTVQGIYEEYFNPETENARKYAPLWYRFEDKNGRNKERKPWIIAKNNNTGEFKEQNYSALPDEIRNFFYLRESAWFVEELVPYAFPTDVDNPHLIDGMISVSVAQHTSGAFSDSVFETDRTLNRGRGWSETDEKNDESRIPEGSNYRREWNTALLKGNEVQSVFLSTWNEWVAQKQPYKACGRRSCYFVDQYNPEFSRDIEPMAGGFFDNYYMQTAKNVRAFKGIRGDIPAESARAAEIDDFTFLEKGKEYYGFAGAATHRKCKSANFSLPDYINDTGRNNIVKINALHDEKNLYFLLTCEQKITAYESGDETYMNLLISVENGGEYIINRSFDGTTGSVEEIGDKKAPRFCGYARIVIKDDRMGICIPVKTLGLGREFSLSFKAMDGVADFGNLSEIYTDGVCCPIGRFKYFYKGKN